MLYYTDDFYEIVTVEGDRRMEYHTGSEAETEALGEELGRTVPAGTVIAFTGDLGAGKTAFTRGLARGLGYPGRVTSPTFTVVNEYEGGRLPLFHFDMYRRGGVCAVEWSENVAEALPAAVRIDIRRGEGDSDRVITITQEGEST